jgi:hypothetical protein
MTEALEWADKCVHLLVAQEQESAQRVLGVLHANLVFQPNVGQEFMVEKLLVRRDLSVEQKGATTRALFIEFHKARAMRPTCVMNKTYINMYQTARFL